LDPRFNRRRDVGKGGNCLFHWTYTTPATGTLDSVAYFGLPRVLEGVYFQDSISSIWDVAKKHTSSGKYPNSPVQHCDITSVVNSRAPFSFINADGAIINFVEWSLPFTLDEGVWDPFLRVPVDLLSEFAWDSFIQWSQQIPSSGTNLGNFVLELRDFKELLPKIEESLIGTVENGFLNYSFGLGPFISDLQNLNSIVSTVKARIAYLKKTYGKSSRLSAFKPNAYDYPSSLPIFTTQLIPLGATPFAQFRFEYRLSDYHTNLRIGAYQRQTLIGLDDSESIFRAYLAALGLTNLPKTVWNAIPFSFVVDWFAKIGTQLDSLNAQPFDGPWSIENVTYSQDTSYTLSAVLVVDDTPYGGSYRETVVSTYKVHAYTRDSGLPARLLDLSNPLSPTQLALLFTLFHQGTK
jgi:hypothetical protein